MTDALYNLAVQVTATEHEDVQFKTRSRKVHVKTYDLTPEDLNIAKRYVHIHSRRFGFSDSEDDHYQTVIMDMIRTDIMGRFNPQLNSKKGYISIFVRNYFCKVSRVAQYLPNKASSLDATPDAYKSVPSRSIPNFAEEASSRIFDIVATVIPYASGALYRGPTFIRPVKKGEHLACDRGEYILWRSAENVLRLMYAGFNQDEIASILKVSKGWVSKQLARVRKHPTILKMWDEVRDD